MFYSDDPVRDFERHDRQQEEKRANRPECVFCGEHIQDEHYYKLHEGITCPSCLNDHFREDNYQ